MREVAEDTGVHTRMLKCTLQIDESRAYWSKVDAGQEPSASVAFEDYWFGEKTLPWVKILLTNMRARYSAYPDALWVLHRWSDMEPAARKLLAHWHVQLSDPMYRAFSGDFLVERRSYLQPSVSRAAVIRWVEGQGPARWTHASHAQFASKLLSTAHAAGLIGSTRDPRPLSLPRLELQALEYLLYLLREVRIEGSLVDNAYLRSVGVDASSLASVLRRSEVIEVQTLGGVTELQWFFPSLRAWAEARLGIPSSKKRGAS